MHTLPAADEPTLLFTEAQFLKAIADFEDLHEAALAQCVLLRSRFVLLDVHGDTLSLSDPATKLLARRVYRAPLHAPTGGFLTHGAGRPAPQPFGVGAAARGYWL